MNRRSFLASGIAFALGGLIRPLFAGESPNRVIANDRFDPVVGQLRSMVDSGELPFATLRIARHGKVLAQAHLSGREAIGPDSLYRIYSMTKPVVASGTMLLVGDGKLALEDPVAKYVPEFADLRVMNGAPDVLEPARTMTVAHLLTHSCGLANSWGDSKVAPLYRDAGLVAAAWMYDPEIGGLDGFAKRLGALPLAFQPGTDWVYGYGLDIAGLVIQRISGQRLGEFLRQRIFDPLGMASTGFFVPDGHARQLAGLYTAGEDGIRLVSNGSESRPLRKPFADAGSAGLISTLEDYGRYADMLASGGSRNGVRVMSEAATRTQMTAYGVQAPLLDSLQRFGSYAAGSVGQALAGIVRTDDRSGPGSSGEYAWGGAAGTGFWAAPELGLSVTVMTQKMPVAASSARDKLRPSIYAAVAASA